MNSSDEETGEKPMVEQHNQSADYNSQNNWRETNRRAYLKSIACISSAGFSGCLQSLGANDLLFLSAGSLATVFEEELVPQFEQKSDYIVHGEYYGSNAIMRMVEEKQKQPDVIISADATLLRNRLYDEWANWDIEFASNTVGLAYNSRSEVATDLLSNPWYDVLQSLDEGELAIADPDLDPIGYRTIQAFELAQMEHDLSNDFASTLVDIAYKEPMPELLIGVETGNRSIAVAYENMAMTHDLNFKPFPVEYNFSSPDYAKTYSAVEYTTDSGQKIMGRPVSYSMTIPDRNDVSDSAREFVRHIMNSSSILNSYAVNTSGYPVLHGDVPIEVK